MHCFALSQPVQSTGTFGGETASPWKQTESTVPTEGLGFGNSLSSGEVMEQLYELGTKDVQGREVKALGLKSTAALCTDVSAEVVKQS